VSKVQEMEWVAVIKSKTYMMTQIVEACVELRSTEEGTEKVLSCKARGRNRRIMQAEDEQEPKG
jgi:hypothetical protein